MRVIALGGAGNMGRPAVRALAGSELVTAVVIADKDLAAAEQLAAEIGAKASARAVDAGSEDQLAAVMAEGHLVINTCGPFFKFGATAVRAAIRAERNYCDINDDWRPTHQVLALDSAAKNAGIVAIVGIGASPGLSNLMAKHAVAQLDTVDEIQTCWLADAQGEVQDEGHGGEHVNAALEHLMYSWSGRFPTFSDGRAVEVDAQEPGLAVTTPGGAVRTLYHVGHPEPVTLPRFISGVRTVANLGGLFPPQLNDLARQQAQRVSAGGISPRAAALAFLAGVMSEPERWLARGDAGPASGLWVVAYGRKAGRRVRYACELATSAADMGTSTGRPLALAALKILRGEIRQRGVLPPEAALDPMPFFNELTRLGPTPLVTGGSPLIESSRPLD
ncbi:MAG: saccharopine dehydrogenase NADP-binding domain-containing protein [Deltaproteobacteria bacterium]|nr:saccharopine dehydrogenase NADP-binding domain-containing protein [Deltaproteobacteria bacterium]